MATVTYKCPNCGAGLRFAPELQKYKCDFCGASFTQKELDALRLDEASEQTVPKEEAEYFETVPDKAQQEPGQEQKKGEAVVYTCPSCGASIVTDSTTAATFCYYCHSPIVLQGRLTGTYLPDRVVPFKYDKKKAQEIFLDYVKHKHFVPRDFFSKDQIEKLSGVYYPFWVYDTTIDGNLSGRADRIRTYISGDREFTETSVYHVERGGRIGIQNLSRNALSESDRNLIDSVMPFRLRETEPFSMGYLQGFVAQKRDIEKEQIAGEMRNRAKKYADQALRQTLTGYSTVTAADSDFQVQDEHYSYMLLPVWLLTYKALSGKKYFFAMNGQTGEIHGKLPVSYGKLSAVAGGIGGIVFVLVLALLYLFL